MQKIPYKIGDCVEICINRPDDLWQEIVIETMTTHDDLDDDAYYPNEILINNIYFLFWRLDQNTIRAARMNFNTTGVL